MLKLLSITTLAALAQGQPPPPFSAFEMSATIASSLSTMSHDLAQVQSQLGNTESPMAIGVQQISADMSNRARTMLTTAQTNNGLITRLGRTVDEAAEQTANANAAMQATVSASIATLTNTVNSDMAGLESAIDGRIAGVLSTLATTTSEINAGVAAADSTIAARVTVQIRAVNTSLAAVTTALAGKKDDALHIWIGSCSNHGNGGWREYCYNRVNVDTARPYFRKENNSRMRTITSGYFKMQFYRLFQSCNWEHTLLYFDGNHRRHTHTWTGGNSQWRDQDVYLTWPMAANKQSWARAWTCGWTIWNTSDQYSRFIMTYEGPLPA